MDIFQLIHYTLSFYSFMVLCYIPFTDRLRQNRYKLALGIVLIGLFFSVFPGVLKWGGYSEATQILSIIFYFVFFFYYKRTVQEGGSKLLFMTFISVHSLCMGTELEFAITTLAGVFPLALPTPPSWYVLFIFVRIILYLMVGLFIYHMLTPRMREIKSVSMRGLLILPAIFAAISIYRGADYYYSGRIDPLYPITFLLLAIASFFVYWHILRMLDNSAKNAQLEIEAQRLETKAEFYRRMNHKIRTPLTRVSTNIQIANMREITDHERLIKAQQEIMQVSEMISTKQNDDDSGWEEG
ncbi:MAG: hypothetical protein LBV33_05570 [Lachnospiraceae bacterium]|nr:hypothetical protein [Lachnospiraceae bacterium]